VAGAFGSGSEALKAALARGTPAKAPEEVKIPGGETVRALLADTEELSRFMDRRQLRRIDRYARLALLGAHLAIADAGVTAPLGARTALVIASGYGAVASTFGFLDTMIEGGDALSSPTLFSNSVHNAAAAQISMALDITGPNLTVTQLGISVTSALVGAAHLLAEGAADAVLFGAVDEFSPVYAYGIDGIQGPAIHGEGTAFFWLTRRVEDAKYGFLEAEIADCPVPAATGPRFVPTGATGKAGSRAISSENIHGALPTRGALDLAAVAARVWSGAETEGTVVEWDGRSLYGTLRISRNG
jgi:3-oxoacyl-[acyl-carrier-protein] synthase II